MSFDDSDAKPLYTVAGSKRYRELVEEIAQTPPTPTAVPATVAATVPTAEDIYRAEHARMESARRTMLDIFNVNAAPRADLLTVDAIRSRLEYRERGDQWRETFIESLSKPLILPDTEIRTLIDIIDSLARGDALYRSWLEEAAGGVRETSRLEEYGRNVGAQSSPHFTHHPHPHPRANRAEGRYVCPTHGTQTHIVRNGDLIPVCCPAAMTKEYPHPFIPGRTEMGVRWYIVRRWWEGPPEPPTEVAHERAQECTQECDPED